MKHKTNRKNTYIVITVLVFTGVVKRLRTTPKRMENSLGNHSVTRVTEEVDFNGKFTYIVITLLMIFLGCFSLKSSNLQISLNSLFSVDYRRKAVRLLFTML